MTALEESLALDARGETGAAREKLAAAAEECRGAAAADPEHGAAHRLHDLIELRLEAPESVGPERIRETLADALAQTFRRGTAFEPRPVWDAELRLALAADSNPNLLDDELVLVVPDSGALTSAESDTLLSLGLAARFQPFYDRRGYTLGFAVDADRVFHHGLDFLDLGDVRGAVLLARGSDPRGRLSGPLGSLRVPLGESRVAFLLQAGTAYLWIDELSYQRRVEAAVSLFFLASGVSTTHLDLVYRDRDYFAGGLGDERRSGELLSVDLGQAVYFRRGDGVLRAAIRYADSRARREFAARILEPRVELGWSLGRQWHWRAELAWRREDYRHPESDLFHFDPLSPPDTPRDDETWRLDTVLSRRLRGRLQLDLTAAWSRRDSDLEGPGGLGLDYERWVASVGLVLPLGGTR